MNSQKIFFDKWKFGNFAFVDIIESFFVIFYLNFIILVATECGVFGKRAFDLMKTKRVTLDGSRTMGSLDSGAMAHFRFASR